jgi:hypothetical protein
MEKSCLFMSPIFSSFSLEEQEHTLLNYLFCETISLGNKSLTQEVCPYATPVKTTKKDTLQLKMNYSPARALKTPYI